MRASSEYLRYLRHFGPTLPMGEFHLDRGKQGIGLRHDVDYELEAALALGRAEADLGSRSTYYLLHSASYWNGPGLEEACVSLHDLGHEIGLHLNVLAEWYEGKLDDVSDCLRNLLERLRAAGIPVIGCAAHGDPLCYRGNFANHWIFEELRGDDPWATETGTSAEGIRDQRPRFQLQYPADHELTRPDGRRMPLWSVSMAKFGLEYHAFHVPHDRYFSDSGGSWKRTPDPLGVKFEGGRWQVLVHPEYWLAPPRVVVSFGKPVPVLMETAERRGFVPVSAEGVAEVLRKSALMARAKNGDVRAALSEVQRYLPKRSDALVYGMPQQLRDLWQDTYGGEEGVEPGVMGGDDLWLERAQRLSGGAESEAPWMHFRGVGPSRHAQVSIASDGLLVEFKRRQLLWAGPRVVYLRSGQGFLPGRGNWRVCVDLKVDEPGASLEVTNCHGLVRQVWRKAVSWWRSAISADFLERPVFWRVTKLAPGKQRITFRLGQISKGEEFVLCLRPSEGFGGRVWLHRFRIERADDSFFAAEPQLESVATVDGGT